MADRFEDHRGVIQDILGPVDAVTHIFTRAGAVRGNHVHHKTIQHTWILSGRLLIVTDDGSRHHRQVYGPGEMATEEPGVAHAWKALEDTEVLVFTKGPRSGENYESDTVRLKTSLLDKELVCECCHQPGTDDRPVTVMSGGALCHSSCLPVRSEDYWADYELRTCRYCGASTRDPTRIAWNSSTKQGMCVTTWGCGGRWEFPVVEDKP